MVPAINHVFGWVILGLISFLQPFGFIATDTKHDLLANPSSFLAGAARAWTDTFTLGQLQNQAYGYIFPQGAFFWLFDALPDVFTQRLWWWIVLGVGYSGFLLLLNRIGITNYFAIGAAFLYALSPRSLSTLTIISSETWPVMLAPWVLWPLIAKRPNIAASILAVACMGAINATATLAACVPAALFLLWRWCWRSLITWTLGAISVCLWWIIPLIILGRYASPFTDYIENATVVTRWLNLAEILRGTTSWSPFVDAERQAGNALATDPYLIIFTLAVAAFGLFGMTRITNLRGFWFTLFGVGLIILGGAHHVTGFLDGAGTPLRNVHKFDPLIRIPLLVGFAQLGGMLLPNENIRAWLPLHPRRGAALALVALVSFSAISPAWAGRLLPLGAYKEVPEYWAQATNYLNAEAQGTRTLILPASSFARQTWGWTRDEPAQALLDVPWAVRDAIPLVNPEAIRGLDGISNYPTPQNLLRLGIGAVIIRHDLARPIKLISAERFFPGAESHRFGDIEVVILDRHAGMTVVDRDKVPTVAGGGEALALLGSGAYSLTSENADIVTDTPLLVARNYGALDSTSATLADPAEATDVFNPVSDYPSVGPRTKVAEHGGQVQVSSSAGDATSFTGAKPSRGATSAVDGLTTTAWYPRPGKQQGEWIELRPTTPVDNPVLEVQLVARKPTRVEVEITSNDTHVTKLVKIGERIKIPVPGLSTSAVRLTLGSSATPIGVAEISLANTPITREITVPNTSPNARQFVFNQVFSYTEVLQRSFTIPRTMQVTVSLSACIHPLLVDGITYHCGDVIYLQPGQHNIRTKARIVKLTEVGFNPDGAPTTPLGILQATNTERLIITNRAANAGLIGTLNGTQLKPITINSGIQAFIVPPGLDGEFHLSFAGDRPYQLGLIIGGIIACIVVIIAASWKRQKASELIMDRRGGTVIICLGLLATTGWVVFITIPLVWLVLRYTLIGRGLFIAATMTMTAMWLARAPWPADNYAGDSPLLAAACALAILAMCDTDIRSSLHRNRHAPPTNPDV